MSIQRLLKSVVVALAVAGGALAGIGCLLAALFESQGFGGPRDQGPRLVYLIELAVAFVAAVVIPVLLWRRLFEGAPGWVVAGSLAAAGVVVILGISFAS